MRYVWTSPPKSLLCAVLAYAEALELSASWVSVDESWATSLSTCCFAPDAFESTFIPLRSSPNEVREDAAAMSYGHAQETDWQFGTAFAAATSVLAEAP